MNWHQPEMPMWPLSIGQRIKRTDLHRQFGGSCHAGISPSARTPNLFLFTEPGLAGQHGYVDSWHEDGCFHFTGAGQRGNQQFVSGNRAILTSCSDGRALRVFQGTGGHVEYRGLFVLDPNRPFFRKATLATCAGPLRSTIIFRLRPVDGLCERPTRRPVVDEQATVSTVSFEDTHTERPMSNSPLDEPVKSALIRRFKDFMQNVGHTVERFRITPAGEVSPIFTDAYVRDQKILVEAK